MNTITPITSLSDTLLELTEEKISKEEIRNGLETISSTSKGLLAFVDSYRKFTHIPTPEPTLFYLKGFIGRMVELARHQYPGIPVTFHASIVPNDLILHADENLISQVIINLLKNAMQAFEKSSSPAEEKHIHIRAYCDEAEAVLIEISNNGPAIPPKHCRTYIYSLLHHQRKRKRNRTQHLPANHALVRWKSLLETGKRDSFCT